MLAVDRLFDRVRRAPPIVVDAAIAAWIFAIGTAGLITFDRYARDHPFPTWQLLAGIGLVALATLGVALRRRMHWAAFALVLLALVGALLANTPPPELALLVVLYTVSTESGVVASLLALLAALVADYLAVWQGQLADSFRHLGLAVGQLVLTDWAWVGLAWFAGRVQARRRRIASDLYRTVAELDQERERLARSAITIERGRIARELHALVLRGVERMNTGIRAARRHLGGDTGRASKAIAEVEAIGRHTLIEMRRLLLILRTGQQGGRSSAEGTDSPERGEEAASGDGQLRELPVPAFDARPEPKGVRWTGRWTAIPWATDALIVAVMAILAAVEPFISPWPNALRIYIPFALVLVGAFLFRRKAPLVVFGLVASVLFVQGLVHLPGGAGFTGDRAMLVAGFTVAALRGRRWGVAALGVQLLVNWRALFSLANVDWALGWSTQMAFAVIAGVAVFEAGRLNEDLGEQTDALRRTKEQRVRRAIEEERIRIARDAHDMVAHGVTLMVIQAGAARWLAESDPAKAEHALGSVERAGQEAVRELNTLMGSLEPSSQAEPLPAPDHISIQSLVDHAVRTGMQVELVVRGEPRELDAGLEISLYRIVQEALTNVRKHAPGARAWVELVYMPDGVEIEVTDTGVSGGVSLAPTAPGAGQGLVGIAERAALFGGQAEAAPTPEGGFRVHASLGQERMPV